MPQSIICMSMLRSSIGLVESYGSALECVKCNKDDILILAN